MGRMHPGRIRLAAGIGLLLLAVPLFAIAGAGAGGTWSWDNVPRVVAFGDAHGAYDRLESLLRESGVIDGQGLPVGQF